MGIDNELRESARIIYSRVLKCVVNNCSDDQKYYSKAYLNIGAGFTATYDFEKRTVFIEGNILGDKIESHYHVSISADYMGETSFTLQYLINRNSLCYDTSLLSRKLNCSKLDEKKSLENLINHQNSLNDNKKNRIISMYNFAIDILDDIEYDAKRTRRTSNYKAALKERYTSYMNDRIISSYNANYNNYIQTARFAAYVLYEDMLSHENDGVNKCNVTKEQAATFREVLASILTYSFIKEGKDEVHLQWFNGPSKELSDALNATGIVYNQFNKPFKTVSIRVTPYTIMVDNGPLLDLTTKEDIETVKSDYIDSITPKQKEYVKVVTVGKKKKDSIK